jgi:hypothetical protein
MTTAIFLDFENVFLGIPRAIDQHGWAESVVDEVIDDLDDRPTIMRAYGNWDNYDQASTTMARLGFQVNYVLSQYGKNSADLEMSLDMHELLMTNDDITHFVIISGDRDFMPIARRIIEASKSLTIASFSRCMSNDLKTAASRGDFIDLDEYLPEEVQDAVLDERDEKMLLIMKLVVQAHQKYGGKDIWLAPFYRDWLNPAMPQARNDERKDLITSLEGEHAIEVMHRNTNAQGEPVDRSYAVIVPNEDHDLYAQAERVLEGEERRLA